MTDDPGQFEFSIPLTALIGGIVVAAMVLIAFLVLRRYRRRRRVLPPPLDLRIDLEPLGNPEPPETGPQLELYNVPVRLAVLVVAPVGRGSKLPPEEELPEMMNQIVPGLAAVVAAHEPIIRRWGPQLSSHGFASIFFSNVRLPGDRGKGTPWCGVAGRGEMEGKKFLVGFALCAASSNGLTQLIVERETQWLDLLRVRT